MSTLIVPISLLESGFGSLNTGTLYRRGASFNPDDYDGVTEAYFEVLAINDDSVARTITLRREGVEDIDSVSIPSGAGSAVFPVRVRSATNIAEDLSWSGYEIIAPRLEQTNNASDLICVAARLIIKQVDPTKTRLQAALCGSPGVNSVPHTLFGSTTYSQQDGDKFFLWLKEAAKYADLRGASPWTLETVAEETGSGSDSTLVRLFNDTDGTQVAGALTETVLSGASPEVRTADFADDATNFDDGDNFEVRVRSNVGGHNSSLYAARLYVRLENLSKGVLWKPAAFSDLDANLSEETFGQSRQFHEGFLNASSKAYIDVTGRKYDAGTALTSLVSSTTTSGQGSRISGSEAPDLLDNTKKRVRSGDISGLLTNNRDILGGRDDGTGAVIISAAYLVEEFQTASGQGGDAGDAGVDGGDGSAPGGGGGGGGRGSTSGGNGAAGRVTATDSEGTTTFDEDGTYTAPGDETVTFVLYGPGGGGGGGTSSRGGGGGGSGQWSTIDLALSEGQEVDIVIGQAGTGGGPGANGSKGSPSTCISIDGAEQACAGPGQGGRSGDQNGTGGPGGSGGSGDDTEDGGDGGGGGDDAGGGGGSVSDGGDPAEDGADAEGAASETAASGDILTGHGLRLEGAFDEDNAFFLRGNGVDLRVSGAGIAVTESPFGVIFSGTGTIGSARGNGLDLDVDRDADGNVTFHGNGLLLTLSGQSISGTGVEFTILES